MTNQLNAILESLGEKASTLVDNAEDKISRITCSIGDDHIDREETKRLLSKAALASDDIRKLLNGMKSVGNTDAGTRISSINAAVDKHSIPNHELAWFGYYVLCIQAMLDRNNIRIDIINMIGIKPITGKSRAIIDDEEKYVYIAKIVDKSESMIDGLCF